MYLGKIVRAAALLAGIFYSYNVSAQQSPSQPVKEVQVGSNAFTLGDPVPSWVDPTSISEAIQPRPLTVRLAETQFLVGPVPVTFVRRAVLVNDSASLTAAGRISISFAPEYERVQLHWIWIHRAQEQLDRTTSSSIRFLQREQGLDQAIYSGLVTASILIDDLRVGDTIDFAYSTYGQNPVFGGKFFRISAWDQSLPTLRRRVVLNYPADRPIAWRMVGDRTEPMITPSESMRDGMRRIDFDQQDMPEIVPEALAPPDFLGFRLLQFSEFASWGEVAKWANALFDTRAPVHGELQAVVDRLRALESDEARITAALEFVQSQIRYFSIALGESSHRPALPDEVLRRRYGDCKDKSLLLITLLHELGIESGPVLIEVGRRAGLEKVLPSPQFFDHVIVRVALNGRTFFLDPTRLGQHGLLDRMGQAHQGAQILVATPDNSELSAIPASNSEDIDDEVTEHATLMTLGDDGRLDFRRVWNRLSAERFRVLFERTPRDQIVRFIASAMEGRYPGATLVGEPVIQDDPVNNVFSVAATYKVPKFAAERDGNWVVSFRPENLRDILTISPTANRTTPLRILASPYRAKYSFEVIFPEQVSEFVDPRAQTIENKYFRATTSDYFRGNIARKSVDLATLRPFVEAENYPGYADDYRSLNKTIGGSIFVSKYAIKSNESSAPSGFTNRLKDLSQEAIKKATETIDGGKLKGADLAGAHCVRANAYAELDRYDEALRDANAAVRLAPSQSFPFICRAEAHFRAGQFDKSVADYSKSISLGSMDAAAFRSRGVSRLYEGRLEEAKLDLIKASELADKETRLYCDIWLIISYARLGEPVPGDVVQRAAAEARGEWPRAGLAMLVGVLSPDDLIKIVDEKKGDERQLALVEAYFLIGQRYLMSGDKKTAQAYFEKARELGVIVYTEHIAAGFELARLKDDSERSASTTPPSAPSQREQ